MKQIYLSVCFLILCGCSASPTKENADHYTLRGYHDYSMSIVKLKAKEGEIWAFLRMASAYHLGRGVRKDYKEAIKWYEKTAFASRRNFRETDDGLVALYHLANLYLDGKGVEKNPQKAYEYISFVYEKADGKPVFYCCKEYQGGRWIAKEMIEYTYFQAKSLAKNLE